MAIAIIAMMAPGLDSLAQDAAQKQQIEKGREVFLTAAGIGCKACHGPYAEGDTGIGPYNRGVGEPTIRAALATIEAMQMMREELSDAQIKQIAAYYQWLGQLKLVKTLIKRGRFIPDRIEIHPGTRIQLVLNNASSSPQRFISTNMGIGPITVGPKDAVDVVWEAPNKNGSFTLTCADCALKDQKLVIEVTSKAPKFVPVKVPSKLVASAALAPAPQAKPPAAVISIDAKSIEQGRQIFLNAGEVGCVACHGRYAEGDVGIGPYNRGFSETAIRGALKSVGPMAFLRDTLNEQQIKQISAYYQSLLHQQLVKTHSVRGVFIPGNVKVHPGTTIQLVIMNPSLNARNFVSQDMKLKRFKVAGRDAVDVVWKAPDREGKFTLECTDCAIKGQKFTLEVSNSVPPYTPSVALK
jgi:mono/diheme cytochrome c family protein